jgi:hypothetical protein
VPRQHQVPQPQDARELSFQAELLAVRQPVSQSADLMGMGDGLVSAPELWWPGRKVKLALRPAKQRLASLQEPKPAPSEQRAQPPEWPTRPEQSGLGDRQVSQRALLVAQQARRLAPQASPPHLARPLPALEQPLAASAPPSPLLPSLPSPL